MRSVGHWWSCEARKQANEGGGVSTVWNECGRPCTAAPQTGAGVIAGRGVGGGGGGGGGGGDDGGGWAVMRGVLRSLAVNDWWGGHLSPRIRVGWCSIARLERFFNFYTYTHMVL